MFRVEISIRPSPDGSRIDVSTLKVTALKRILGRLFRKDITADVADYVVPVDCAAAACDGARINIQEFDLSEHGTGHYRFEVVLSDVAGRIGAEDFELKIGKE